MQLFLLMRYFSRSDRGKNMKPIKIEEKIMEATTKNKTQSILCYSTSYVNMNSLRNWFHYWKTILSQSGSNFLE